MRSIILTFVLCTICYGQGAGVREESDRKPVKRVVADDPVVLPNEIKLNRGRLKIVTVTTAAKKVEWVWFPQEAIDVIPFPDGKSIVISAPEDCVVELYAFSASEDVPIKSNLCRIVVGSPVPPTPPIPPQPDIDTFQKALKSAMSLDGVDASVRQKFIDFYTDAATITDDVETTTTAQLYQVIKLSTDQKLPEKGTYTNMRKVIADYLKVKLTPVGTDPISSTTRNKWKQEFKYVADSIRRLEK